MIAVGTLSASYVRETYLRGIDLGEAWAGPGADAAIQTLLAHELARAEELMAIHFQRWIVAAPPEATSVAGTDYDVAHAPIPYAPPLPGDDRYRLTLWHHDVQAIVQVRPWLGWSTDVVPVSVFGTSLDLTALSYAFPDESLHIPTALVPDPTPVQGWAVDYMIGLGQIPASVQQWCALGAAIQVLSQAGASISKGLSSASLSMDGIEERYAYAGGGGGLLGRGSGGIYSGPISVLQAQRDDIDLVKLRFRYQGTHFPVAGVAPPPSVVYPLRP